MYKQSVRWRVNGLPENPPSDSFHLAFFKMREIKLNEGLYYEN
jgi:hypothetical protein